MMTPDEVIEKFEHDSELTREEIGVLVEFAKAAKRMVAAQKLDPTRNIRTSNPAEAYREAELMELHGLIGGTNDNPCAQRDRPARVPAGEGGAAEGACRRGGSGAINYQDHKELVERIREASEGLGIGPIDPNDWGERSAAHLFEIIVWNTHEHRRYIRELEVRLGLINP